MTLVVPTWLTDAEAAGPCPCGEPPVEGIIIVNGEHLKRWFHEPCLDWLQHELNDEQLKDLEEWRKHRRDKKT